MDGTAFGRMFGRMSGHSTKGCTICLALFLTPLSDLTNEMVDKCTEKNYDKQNSQKKKKS